VSQLPNRIAIGVISRGLPLIRRLHPIINRVVPDMALPVTVLSGAARGSRLVIKAREEKFYWTGMHEPHLQRALTELLRPGQTFWDIGAHIGFFAVIASRIVGSSGQVHCFEPMDESRDRLGQTVELNGLANVHISDVAVSRKSGHAELYPHRLSPMWTLANHQGGRGGVTVRVRSLDDLAAEIGAPQVIKIDVEGAELEVIRGGLRLLGGARPVLLVEFSTEQLLAQARNEFDSYTFEHLADNHWLMRPTADGGSMSRSQAETPPVKSQVLEVYLEQRRNPVPRPPDLPRRIVRAVVPSESRPVLRRLLTRAVTPRSRRNAVSLARRIPLRLNLGSAKSHLPGWVNVDLIGDGADLAWDLARPLPFDESTVDAIFHEHVLEHFELPVAVALLRESHRLLAPGGVLRIGVPDAGAYLHAYCDPESSFLDTTRPDRPTPMLAVQEVFFDSGHRSAYDFQTLALLLVASGFHSVERRLFGESLLEPCPDGQHRRQETLYVEARR
jgi:FkbM family methyltransferase